MKKIAILGVSGSIGKQTVEVILEHQENFSLVAFSVNNNLEYAFELLSKFTSVKTVCVKDVKDLTILKQKYPQIDIYFGEEGLIKVATVKDVTMVVNALVGFVGLMPTIKAIENKKDIALANKETLVVAGHIIKRKVLEYGVNLYPIDSEHSALAQCLVGEDKATVKNLILTASGGPFFRLTKEELATVTIKDALKHPSWSMGAKITIDSATMVNKGLEVMEAHWLFDMPYENIKILIHPQSIIHSLVEYIDGSIKAQLGIPSMKIPILYALSQNKRMSLSNVGLDLVKKNNLEFYEADFNRFKSLRLAYEVGIKGHSLPTVYNGANEALVSLFLNGQIPFNEIEDLIEKAINHHSLVENPSIEQIIAIDKETKEFINAIYKEV